MKLTPNQFQLAKAAIVFPVGFLIAYLLMPKKKDLQKRQDRITQKVNAAAALEAARMAIASECTNEEFEALKQDIQKKYGLRLYYKPQDERYYVADSEGRDILRS